MLYFLFGTVHWHWVIVFWFRIALEFSHSSIFDLGGILGCEYIHLAIKETFRYWFGSERVCKSGAIIDSYLMYLNGHRSSTSTILSLHLILKIQVALLDHEYSSFH
jgi:hypothetical protein